MARPSGPSADVRDAARTVDTPGTDAPDRAVARVARGGAANLIGAAITAVCTFALTVVVARGVSRSDAGVFFATTSLFLVATTIGQLGTQTGLVYFLARCRARRTPEAIGAYVRAAVRPMLALAIVMALGMLVFARQIAGIIISGPDAGEAATYLRWLAIFIPVAGIEIVLLAGTRGLGSMRAYTLTEQISRPILQLILVAIAATAAASSFLGLAWAVGYVPAAVVAWLAFRRQRAKYPRPTADEPTRPVMAEFWKFTLPRSLTSTIQMLMQRFDIVLVAAIAGPIPAAIYAAATRFIVLGQLGINALTIAAQPQFAAKLTTGDHRSANELYQVTTAWLILVTWPVYFSLIVFAEPILRVFGHGYSAGNTVIVLIACSMLIGTGTGMVDTVLAMAGRTLWNLGNAAIALAVNLGLDFWLIPKHGIVGAAIGWAVAIAVRNIAAATQVGISLRFHPIARSTICAVLLTVGCFAGVLGIARLATGESATVLIVAMIIALVLYLIGLVALRRPLRLDSLVALRRPRPARQAT
jgi:O-antigen/teichoic acid export membrane protein